MCSPSSVSVAQNSCWPPSQKHYFWKIGQHNVTHSPHARNFNISISLCKGLNFTKISPCMSSSTLATCIKRLFSLQRQKWFTMHCRNHSSDTKAEISVENFALWQECNGFFHWPLGCDFMMSSCITNHILGEHVSKVVNFCFCVKLS